MKTNNQLRFGVILLLFLVLLFSTSTIQAQDRTHNGFYLSMQTGPAFGYINGNSNQSSSYTVSGTGFAFDIQIGGAIKENLILHGTIVFKSIFGPEFDDGVNKVTISKDYSFDELMMGIGTTRYLRNNFFITANIGLGQFSLADDTNNTTIDTDYGFSYQLKIGKEWWISNRWGLGAAFEYGGTRTKDTMGDYQETWQSHRFGIKFTATLNNKKEL